MTKLDFDDLQSARRYSAMDAYCKAILAELARRGLGIDAVLAIFLSHGHSDHIAGAHLFPGANIYALADDVALIEGREAAHGPLTKLMGAKPTGLHVQPLKDVSGVLFLGDSGAMTTAGKLVGPPWAFTDDVAKSRASLVALGDARSAASGRRS